MAFDTRDIPKPLLDTNNQFIKDLYDDALKLAYIAEKLTETQLNKELEKILFPLFDRLFFDGLRESNKVISSEIARLVNVTDVPFKYNKEVIDDIAKRVNTKSVFTGYYDEAYKDLFSKREIDALKRAILSGKYNNLTDTQIADKIQNVVNITKNRALTTARMETQRLEGSVQDLYYQQANVKNLYYKVYKIADSNARPTHRALNNQIANDEGYFTNVNGVKFRFPPEPDSPYGCRCRSELVLRSIIDSQK